MTLGTRLGVMNHGRIVQVGTPSDIYESPATRFVADFIGSVNMFEGEVRDDGSGGLRIRCAELGCTVRAERAAGLRARRHGVDRDPPGENQYRAPAARRTGPDSAENVVRGTVREIAYMGDMSIYLVRIESGQHVAGDAAEHHAWRRAADRARGERVALLARLEPRGADRVAAPRCASQCTRRAAAGGGDSRRCGCWCCS